MRDVDERAPSLTALGEAARGHPQDPDAWLRYGLALHSAGHHEQALQCIKRAAGVGRDNPTVLTAVGEAFETVGAIPEALTAGRRASQLPNSPPDAAALVGRVLTKMGDGAAAALSLRVAIGRHPDSAPLQLALAQALVAADRPHDATQHIERAVALAPNDPDVHRVQARLHERLGDQDSYIEALGRVTALDESDVTSAVALGGQMARRGRQKEAVDLLINASARGPKTAQTQLSLGSGFLEVNALTAAIKHLKESIRLQPDLAPAHLKLGVAHRKNGSLPDAIASLRKATLLASENSEYHYELGLALLDAGQPREAANVLIRAAAFSPDDDNIQEALAQAFNQTRKPQPTVREDQDDSEPSEGSFSGDLRLFSVAELLDFLLNQRATGTLVVRGPQGDGRIELYQGSLVGARHPGGKPLSRHLLDNDLLSLAELKRHVISPEDLDRDAVVATVLAKLNLVDMATLEKLVQREIQEALQEMLTWDQGDAVFRRDPQRSAWPEPPEIRLDTRWVLIDATRRLDEKRGRPPR